MAKTMKAPKDTIITMTLEDFSVISSLVIIGRRSLSEIVLAEIEKSSDSTKLSVLQIAAQSLELITRSDEIGKKIYLTQVKPFEIEVDSDAQVH